MVNKEFIQKETENLVKQWESYQQDLLSDYLVQSLQDPRINPQSILARHEIIKTITRNQENELFNLELEFAFNANKMLRDYEKENNVSVHNLSAVKKDLPENKLYQELYKKFLEESQQSLSNKWVQSLEPFNGKNSKIKILEAACGCANDYRFFKDYGFENLIDYKGFDLNKTNVKIAHERHPEATFTLGNILDIKEEDQSWDLTVMHDIFEHLHIDACYEAMREVFRVTNNKIIVTYFSMDEIPDHLIKPVKHYHWNTLSRSKIEEYWKNLGASVEVINIPELSENFGFNEFHNKKAYTFVITRV